MCMFFVLVHFYLFYYYYNSSGTFKEQHVCALSKDLSSVLNKGLEMNAFLGFFVFYPIHRLIGKIIDRLIDY